ncbi:MAG: hypothetical protein IPP71_18350 [Bacteroidetes bacterium]|nr:hypothetical protein [Bacteroidota bacterium]
MVNPSDVTLKNIKFEYDAFEEVAVAILDQRNFKGWNSLTIATQNWKENHN